jgi:phenylalanine-4-hydroxylase
MMRPERQLPEHLRKYVVSQDYGAYTVEDQAVWRFVLLSTYERHLRTAHPAYAAGFAAAGISVEYIPDIERMNERLTDASFEAICVDGFIPPRAFQAFQARGFLPIAADIRTSRHLTYTPAPDIIHEAAGHAPFLAHPDYAHFVKRIGAIGEKAFAGGYDRDVYNAIYLLSELKEDPGASSAQIAAAEARLSELTAHAPPPSEAARLARLYWWTVEYGLIGSPLDYRLYGAGLLSSIGEGHFCHDPAVAKLPLSAACVDVPYDITRPQPQLFVASDFNHLTAVLREVSHGFAYEVGGEYALSCALASTELATLEFAGDLQLVGTVEALLRAEELLAAVRLNGPCAVAVQDEVLAALSRVERYVMPLGTLRDGTPLDGLTRAAFTTHGGDSERVRLSLASGIEITGRVLSLIERAGRVRVALLSDCKMTWGEGYLLHEPGPYPLLLAARVVTAHARPPRGYYPATEFADTSVPKPRTRDAAQRELVQLHEQSLCALRECFGAEVVPRFEAIYRTLAERHPQEWLLRWSLLENLIKLGQGADLKQCLVSDLEQLELRYAHREPIATGLAYLRRLASA